MTKLVVFENEHTQESMEMRHVKHMTMRPISGGAEKHMHIPYKALDHGFVRMVDYMGNDAAVAQAARVSYGAGTKAVRNDAGLINYLLSHWHNTPFEMCELKLHAKCPIFVFRQWVRHRTANINEYSGRYSVMASEFYVPDLEQLTTQSVDNKQGRSEQQIVRAEDVRNFMNYMGQQEFDFYNWMLGDDVPENYQFSPSLDENNTVSRELARINLPLSTYTECYWKIDLHNLMHFLRLRADSHAQYEIRIYADIINELLKAWMPITYEAFEEHRLHAQSLSRSGANFVAELISRLNSCDSGMDVKLLSEQIAEDLNIRKSERQALLGLLKV